VKTSRRHHDRHDQVSGHRFGAVRQEVTSRSMDLSRVELNLSRCDFSQVEKCGISSVLDTLSRAYNPASSPRSMSQHAEGPPALTRMIVTIGKPEIRSYSGRDVRKVRTTGSVNDKTSWDTASALGSPPANGWATSRRTVTKEARPVRTFASR
jgi:hypothetical protein